MSLRLGSLFSGAGCVMCGATVSSSRAATCSRSCAARYRETRRTKDWAKPAKVYDPQLVENVRTLYESGLSQEEVAKHLGVTRKVVYRLMINHSIPRRRQVARNQSGPSSASWKGDEAGYQALHLRVEARRGKPSRCSRCSATTGRFEWANLTGRYSDIWDYERMCISCHRHFDAARRRATGKRTSPDRRSS